MSIGKPIQNSQYLDLVFRDIFESHDHIDIYTDGLKIVGNGKSFVGFSAWWALERFDVLYKLPDFSSVFTAEFFAILHSIRLIFDGAVGNESSSYRIFTDSQSIVKSLGYVRGLDCKSPLIIGMRSDLHKFFLMGVDIRIFWIPSHVGITGNEKADDVAKKVVISIYYKISNEHNDRDLKNSSIDTGKFYFLYFYKAAGKPWFHKYNLPREVISFVDRSRSGYTNLNSFLFWYKITDTSECKYGNEVDCIDHIF